MDSRFWESLSHDEKAGIRKLALGYSAECSGVSNSSVSWRTVGLQSPDSSYTGPTP